MIPLSKPVITEVMKKKVMDVLDSGRFIKGPRVKEFEDAFAKYCGLRYGAAVSSGTAAIYLALRALDIKEGDEVICPSHSFVATAEPILMIGAKPVFADISGDYNLDLDDVARKITERTRAIICVHLYGQMCDMDILAELKEIYGLYLIEDAAQAHGAEYDGRKSGSFGDIACFSFFPSKNMTVAGDGGMIVTNNEELDAKGKMLRDHGRDYRRSDGQFSSTMLGFNFRMSEISAVVGMEQLKHLDDWIERRRTIARWYNELLDEDKIIGPKEFERRKHVYHLYVIRSEKRDELKDFLSSKGIETGIHYPRAIHQQPIFSNNWNLPRTEEVCKEILSLPMYPGLREEEVAFVCLSVNKFGEQDS